MPSVNICLTDTPTGGVAVRTDFSPAVGQPCSAAQAAALDMIRTLRKEWGEPPPAPYLPDIPVLEPRS